MVCNYAQKNYIVSISYCNEVTSYISNIILIIPKDVRHNRWKGEMCDKFAESQKNTCGTILYEILI